MPDLDHSHGYWGGNVPLIMFSKIKRAKSKEDYESWGNSEVTNTLNTFDQGDVRATDLVVCKPKGAREDKDPVSAIGVNGQVAGTLDASYYKGCGERQGVEREVVAYAAGNGQLDNARLSEVCGALDCMHDQKMVVIALDRARKSKAYGVPLNFRPENTRLYEEVATTVCSGTNPGHHQGVVQVKEAKETDDG